MFCTFRAEARAISSRSRKVIRHMLGDDALAAILEGNKQLVEALSEVVASV